MKRAFQQLGSTDSSRAVRVAVGNAGVWAHVGGPRHPDGVVLVIPGASASLSRGAALLGTFDAVLQSHFSAQRLATVVFHHRGTGRSDGDLSETSLETREQDVRAVVKAAREWFPSTPIFLVGISMGGHLAALLAGELDVAGIALVCGAAYSPAAASKPFGPHFSACIRRERSWAESRSFAGLASYGGFRLVVASELDEVVPRELSNAYFEASDLAVLLPGARHRIPSCEDETTRRAANAVAQLTAAAFSAAIVRDPRWSSLG